MGAWLTPWGRGRSCEGVAGSVGAWPVLWGECRPRGGVATTLGVPRPVGAWPAP